MDNFFERANAFIKKYTPIIGLLTLLGPVVVGWGYLLSINNHIELTNTLINTYYDELKSQKHIILSFKDSFHTKNEDVIKQLTKNTTLIDGVSKKVNEIKDSLKTIESRLYDLNTKKKFLDN